MVFLVISASHASVCILRQINKYVILCMLFTCIRYYRGALFFPRVDRPRRETRFRVIFNVVLFLFDGKNYSRLYLKCNSIFPTRPMSKLICVPSPGTEKKEPVLEL